MTDKDRVCVCVCVLCYQIDTRNPPMLSFGGKKDEGKINKAFSGSLLGGCALAHVFSRFSESELQQGCYRL